MSWAKVPPGEERVEFRSAPRRGSVEGVRCHVSELGGAKAGVGPLGAFTLSTEDDKHASDCADSDDPANRVVAHFASGKEVGTGLLKKIETPATPSGLSRHT